MNLLIEEILTHSEKTIYYMGIGSYNYLPLFPDPAEPGLTVKPGAG